MRNRNLSTTALAGSLGAILLTAGCFSDVGDIPLPGGAALGSNPYSVQIEFNDVLDLVPQSAVKVNDVTVGRVTDIELKGWKAKVTVKLNDDVKLPDTSVAAIRQTSILGEKFVSLAPPEDGGGTGRLSDGDLIPLARSGHTPEIEQVLASLSLVLNGGALGKAQVISRELNTALSGNESDVKALVQRLNEFVAVADESKAEIVSAIEQIDRLAKTTNDQKVAIDAALDDLPEALQVVNAQRANLVKMLDSLANLGAVGSDVIVESKASVVADIRALAPVLDNLASAGDSLVTSLQVLPTFPFPDSLLGKTPKEAAAYQMGHFMNVSIDFNTDFSKTVGLMTEAERAELKKALTADDISGVMAGSLVAP
ncbi:MAG TPA: MCE family protein [Aeromicrobium sp.]|nr:MCE family protein [Aeromicrobium sp.]